MPTQQRSGDPFLLSVGADQRTDSGDAQFDGGGRALLRAGVTAWWIRMGRLLAASQVLGSPGVGAGLGALIGQPFTPQVRANASASAANTILADPLVASVQASVASPNGTQIVVNAIVYPTGSTVPLTYTWILGG